MKAIKKLLAATLSVALVGAFSACDFSALLGTSSSGGDSSSQSVFEESVENNSNSQSESEEESSVEETQTADAWIVACDGAEVSVVTSGEYVKEGSEKSIKYTHGENATNARVGAGIKFKEYAAQDLEEDFTFYVYNATTYEYKIEIFCHQDATNAVFQDYQEVAEYTAKAGEWTEVKVSASAVAAKCNNGSFDYLGIALMFADNGGVSSNQWKSVELYFDGLELFEAE